MMTTETLKKKQKLIFFLSVGGLMLTILILALLTSDDSEQSFEPANIKDISTATSGLDNESIWIEKSESLLESLQQKDKSRADEIAELKSIIKDQQADLQKERSNYQTKLDDFVNQLKLLQSEPPKQATLTSPEPIYKHTINEPTSETALTNNLIGISKGTLQLASLETADSDKHISHYVPAGSHVKAIILGGVDASASVSAQSDPKPVLLRLMDKGHLPNQHTSDLKDCHITAAAFGDVSSERALMRLETISCVNKKGEVFESKISGYVAGEDGITGVRGQVVHRERELLNHSLVSGLLSGLGKSVESKFSSVTQTPIGATSTIENNDLMKSSIAKGASNALDRYAEYHIERAEQYQPTIQIGAGRMVDVVFTKGWSLKDVKNKREKNNG